VSTITGGFQLAWTANQSGPKLAPSNWTVDIAAVPLPAASWLMFTGLVGLMSLFYKRNL
jgi:hypothetical protein